MPTDFLSYRDDDEARLKPSPAALQIFYLWKRWLTQYLANHQESSVMGIIFYGFPLHPAGKPSTERADHLKTLKVPMLFLQGSKDALATWPLIKTVCDSLRKATLIKLEGADHSFKAGKNDVMALLVNETKKWVEKILK